jgi:AraC family transcriptional regulator
VKTQQPEIEDPVSSHHEEGAWSEIHGTWQPLHGSLARDGMSVEWHDFHVDRDLDWGRSFHPGSLEICLNFFGSGRLGQAATEQKIGPNQVAIYTTQARGMRAFRHAGSLHRFLTLELSPQFLRPRFEPVLDRLKAPVRRFIEEGAAAPPHLEVNALPASLLASRIQFVEPPVPAPARETWYLGRVLEILAQTIFPPEDPQELFCRRHQRMNRARIERARYLLARDLENPPSLEMLAAELGCSSFYLSRIFAQETGVSIPKFLRMKRIEKAAELIRTGRANVTEAALAVGYSSLSAFNKAFVEQMACCPGLYPAVPIAGRKRRK